MIQSIIIYDSEGNPVFGNEFGYMPLSPIIWRFSDSLREMMADGEYKIYSFSLNDLQVHYLSNPSYTMVSFSNLIDSAQIVTESLRRIWNSIQSLLENADIEGLQSVIRDTLLEHTMKVSIFGLHGVGKTTISKMLLKKTLPLLPIPTIGAEIRQVPEGYLGQSRGIRIWDLGGQLRFKSLWPIYLRGSQLVLIVTDSTLESVLWSRKMIPEVRTWSGNAELLGIANKQDLSSALTRERIESILGIRTLGINALDVNSKEHSLLRTQISQLLGIA